MGGRTLGKDQGRHGTAPGMSQGSPMAAGKAPEARKRKAGFFSPTDFRRNVASQRHLNFGIQNCEAIHVCSFKSHSLLWEA